VHRAAVILTFAAFGCGPRPNVAPAPQKGPTVAAAPSAEEQQEEEPRAPLPLYQELRLHPTGPIEFEWESATFRKESLPVLDDLAKQLNDHLDIKILVIEVHSDERGSGNYNVNLTTSRANALRNALIGRGIRPRRLIAKGYGEWCPLDITHTPAAWAKNRRIELLVYENAFGCTGVPIGCKAAGVPNLPACKQP
jgi:outer membrane protein OmpA-like peptidoglycan-associated protein